MTQALDRSAAFAEFERQQADWRARAEKAHAAALPAFSRLLHLAETRDSGQIARVARFLAGCYNGSAFPLDPYDLRTVDVEISDDMLACLDALRWGKADLHTLVIRGGERIEAVCKAWGLEWPKA